MGTNNLSDDIFNLRHVSKVAAHFLEEKQDVHMVIQVLKQRKWKSVKPGCRAVFRTLSNIYDGAFL